MFASPLERPQSVGDLIGRAFRIYRQHIPLFFKVLLMPTVVATVGIVGLQWSLTTFSQWLRSGSDYSVSLLFNKTGHLSALIATMSVSLMVILGAKWVLALRQMSFIRMIAGFATDYSSAYEFISKHKWKVLLTFFLGLVIAGFSLFLFLAQILAMTLMPNPGWSWLSLKLIITLAVLLELPFVWLVGFMVGMATLSVIACEEEPFLSLVGRAMSLIFRDFWRASGFTVLLSVSIALISYPLSLPAMLITSIDAVRNGLSAEASFRSYHASLWVMVASQSWESLVNMLLGPVMFMAFGLFYRDLRLRQEGLDIASNLAARQSKVE